MYQIYTRLSPEAAYGLAPTIGSTDFKDVERTVAFVDEELTFTTAEMRPANVAFLDQDEILEAFEEEDEL